MLSFETLFLIVLTMVIAVLYHQSKKRQYFRRVGIPCTPTWPVLGSLPTAMARGILQHEMESIKRYGKVHGTFLGNLPSMVIADPEFIREIFIKQFHKFPYRMQALYISDWWDNSVVMATGDHWRYMRSVITPAFSTAKLKQMQPQLTASMNTMTTCLKSMTENTTDGMLDMRKVLSALTMDIICSSSFGVNVNTLEHLDNEFSKHAKTVSTLSIESNPLNGLPLIAPVFKKLFRFLDLDYVDKHSLNYIKDFVQSMIYARRAENTTNGANINDILQNLMNSHRKGKDNVYLNENSSSNVNMNNNIDDNNNHVGYKNTIDDNNNNSNDSNNNNISANMNNNGVEHSEMRGLNDDELVANAIVVLMAGYDTTATTLTWMCYLLATNPDIQQKLSAAIDAEIGDEEPTYDTCMKIDYLDWFLSETLRLYPAANRTGRDAVEDTEVCGVQIPTGLSVTLPIYAIHRMPEYWPEPDKCVPERFSPERRHEIIPYTYMPFGVGPRICLGVRMAQMLCKLIVAKLVQNFTIDVSEHTEKIPVLEKSLLTKPKNGMILKLRRRNSTDE